MADTYDAAVIGGGLAGTCVAVHLARAGATTLLVDRRDPGRATDAGAGILSPETNKNELEVWDELVRACGAYYPELVAQLGDTGYERCGLLTLALADWDIPTFDAAAALILERRDRRGSPSPDGLREIDPEEARSLYPPLGKVTRALFHRDAARVDGRRMNAAVLEAARAASLDVRVGSASLVLAGSRAVAIDVGGERLGCGAVVVAGGAWSDEFGSALGITIPVRPARGQIVHLRLREPYPDTGRWPIVQPILGMYQVPWPGGRVAVGATFEPEAGFDPRPTAAGMRLVFGEILRVTPGLADAGFVEVRVGLRPVSVDDLPVLGPVPGWDNVLVATGYGANGLLLSPYCGQVVASCALGQRFPESCRPFLADRFVTA